MKYNNLVPMTTMSLREIFICHYRCGYKTRDEAATDALSIHGLTEKIMVKMRFSKSNVNF